MKNYFMIGLMAFLFLAACGNELDKQVNALRAEVIAVHDEVMPKMTEISKLQNEVSERIASMKGDSTELDMAKVKSAKQVHEALVVAEQAMNDWMVGFHEVDMQKVDAKTMLDALKGEQTKVNDVKEKMLSSIAEAQAFLKGKSNE